MPATTLQGIWGNDMGRPLTPEEMAAYEKRRQESLKEASHKLGIPAERLEELQEKSRLEVITEEWEKEPNRKNRAKAGIEQ